MASINLRARANWQTESGLAANDAEVLFRATLQTALDSAFPNRFSVVDHPNDFADVYSTYPLPAETLEKIHNVDVSQVRKSGRPMYRWGISMDFAVRNTANGKTLFGEIKRQDGWTENTTSFAGRGNAHERSCKYFTPGLMKVLRDKGNVSDSILPFWLIFMGDITRDPRRNREVAFWFQGFEGNYFMWRDASDLGPLLDHFEVHLLPHLL